MTFVLTHAKKDLRKPQTSQKLTTFLTSVAPCFSCGFLQNDSLKLTRPDKHPPPALPFPTSWFQQRLRLPPRLSSQSRLIRSAFSTSVPPAGERGLLRMSQDVREDRNDRLIISGPLFNVWKKKSLQEMLLSNQILFYFFIKWSLYWHCREKPKSNFPDLIYFLSLRKQQESDNVFTGKELVWWNHPLIT